MGRSCISGGQDSHDLSRKIINWFNQFLAGMFVAEDFTPVCPCFVAGITAFSRFHLHRPSDVKIRVYMSRRTNPGCSLTVFVYSLEQHTRVVENYCH